MRVIKVMPAEGGRPASVTFGEGDHRTTLAAPRGIVVATEGPAAERLLGPHLSAAPSASGPPAATCNLYFW